MNPEWILREVRSSIIVRIDLVRTGSSTYQDLKVCIFGSHEDDDGSDPFRFNAHITHVHYVQQMELEWRNLIRGPENYRNFVLDSVEDWDDSWSVEQPNLIRLGQKAWRRDEIAWEELPLGNALTLQALTRVMGMLDVYQPPVEAMEAHGRPIEVMRTLRGRLWAIIENAQREHDGFLRSLREQ